MRRMVLATLALFGCSELPDLEVDACGNGVWEPMAGEDCDTNADEGRCGPPGSVGACRFVCSTSIDCPGGRQCGADGICRLPIRQFVPTAGTPLASVGNDLTIADLDVDGHADLIGTTARGAVVLFGDGTGELSDRRTLITGSPFARVTSARVGGNQRGRIVTPIGGGVQINRVDEQRNLRPVANATLPSPGQDRLRIVRVPTGTAPDWIAALLEIGGRLTLSLQFGATARPLVVDGRLDDLAATPPSVDVDGDGVAEILLGLRGESSVRVLGLVCDDGPVLDCRGVLQWAIRATIPITGNIMNGLALADANADGHPDVFVDTTAGLQIALGNGDGSFDAPEPDRRIDELCRSGCELLAVDDIDADGRADYVFHTSIITTSTPAAVARHTARAGELELWTSAAFGDFDGDGRRDIAVARRGHFGFEIAYGADAPIYNAFFEETSQPLAGLVAADFDGDGVDDIATVTMGFSDQAVVVHYGGPTGPGEGVEMGRFKEVRRVVPTFLAGLGEAQDLRADLVVESFDATLDAERVALLIATPEHQMVSPLLLDQNPLNLTPALAVASGTFMEGSTSDDLLVVTAHDVRIIPADDAGGFPTAITTVIPQGLVRGDTSRRLVETIELDGDPFTEVICVTGAHPNQERDPSKMIVFDPNGAGMVSSVEVPLPEAVKNPSSVRVANIPPFGDKVVVLAFDGDRTPGGVALFPIDPAGNVLAATAMLLTTDERRVLAAEVANIDSDSRPELIVLSEDAVYSIEIRDGVLTWGPPIPLGDVVRPASEFTTLRAADFDRDGLVDLAVANEFGLFVYRGIDRQEAGR